MRKQGAVTIPASNEGDDCRIILFLVPNEGWIAPVFSVVSSLTAGRVWNGNTGSVRDAQGVAEQVMNTFTTCSLQDLLDAIKGISTAVSVNSMCCDAILPPPQYIPPQDGETWPLPGGETGNEIFPIPSEYEQAVCTTVKGLLFAYWRFFDFLETVNWVVLGAAAIMSIVAALIPEPITTVLGTVSFAAIAAAIVGASLYSEAIGESAEQMKSWIEENAQDILCLGAVSATSLHDLLVNVALAVEVRASATFVENGVPDWIASQVAKAFGTAADMATAIIEHLSGGQIAQWAQNSLVVDLTCPCELPGYWEPHLSTGSCAESQATEVVNTKIGYEADIVLAHGNSAPYVFFVDRDTLLLSDTAVFTVRVDVDDNYNTWYFRQYRSGQLRDAVTLTAGVTQQVNVVSSGCDRVVVYRADQLYNAQCPREFNVSIVVTCTDSNWIE